MFLPNKIFHILLSVSSCNVNVFDKLLAIVHTHTHTHILQIQYAFNNG